MENTIASCFTAVDVALAQLASPLCPAGVSDRPHSPAPPDFPAPPDADTNRPGLARPTGDDGNNDAPPSNCFQATTMFSPGSSFPAGNRVSHMRETDTSVEDMAHGTWQTKDRADMGEHTPSRPQAALSTTSSTHFQEGRPSQVPSHQHPGDDDAVGMYPTQIHHNRMQGHRDMDMRPDRYPDHHWLFDDREDDGDEGGYTMMGGPIKSPSNIEHF